MDRTVKAVMVWVASSAAAAAAAEVLLLRARRRTRCLPLLPLLHYLFSSCAISAVPDLPIMP